MAIIRRIATLEFRELVILCVIFLKRPFFLLPTYKATNKAVKLCNRLYGQLHHEDNRTNAFRHALWNYLICKYCLTVAGSQKRAVGWSKEITDLHERLSPNEALARRMDLHNNRIGREIFLKFSGSEEEAISVLQQKTREAVKVESLTEIEEEKENLVFIEKLQ